jgi:hypothetical protein
LAQKAATHESQFEAAKGNYQVAQMMEYTSYSNSNQNEVGIVEWTKNTKNVGCPWVKKEAPRERNDFDISKVDKIFDLLL